MHAHFVGVSGTGMGALAVLFRERGDRVTGSDAAFDAPVGPALRAAGVECLQGYAAEHLEPAPDLVVVGNVIRRENPEARATEERGLRRVSMSGALRAQFLEHRRAVVVCGTHGKTTTSAMAAHVLQRAGLDPGWFVGGLPKDRPAQASAGAGKRRLALGGNAPAPTADAAPFVVEGDEYDDVYWSKKPKFLDYVGVAKDDVVVLTSVEQDHVDIYPSVAAYEAAFIDLLVRVPEAGLVVCDAAQPRAVALAQAHARCPVVFYGVDGDAPGAVTPEWSAALAHTDELGRQHFDAFAGGASLGRFALRVPGAHNVRNALAVAVVASRAFGVPTGVVREALLSFSGVRRRQDLLGTPDGVRVYDDFAHHPTAVRETLRALRRAHPAGRLFAVFEPRSATACRSVHQAQYPAAFAVADRVLFAPLGRANVPEAERLDLARVARDVGAKADAATSVDAIVGALAAEARPGDTIAILSNGAFGGIYGKVLAALEARATQTRPT